MVSDKCWPATRTTIRMPNIWAVGRRTRSAQSVPSVGLIHKGPTFTQFTNTCGATCTTSSPARAQTATCSTKVAGKTTDLSPCTLNIVLLKMFLKNLDAPSEWYLDRANSVLYFYPPTGLDLENAVVEAVRLKHLVEFRGSQDSPVKWIKLRGFTFQHASRTFMVTREPLLRGDWRIYRGGALFFTGAENCYVDDCFLDQLGGNCIFVSGYNRRIRISRSHIARAGANGISFVGERKAVRNPLDSYDDRLSIGDLDLTPGPRTADYPAECLVADTLIYQTGQVEKQTAPVEIDIARAITVRHCSIYDVPRAGINIGDGCWGGHHIDHCDVFDTVKETGDHGS